MLWSVVKGAMRGILIVMLSILSLNPGLWQAARGAEQQPTSISVPSQDTPNQRNWNAFWRHHLGTWNGRWTRYTPSGAIQETFKSSRQFTSNPNRTKVTQVNRYRYDNGKSIEKIWDYNIIEHSRLDGFAHPASSSMRGLALDNGAAAWLVPSLTSTQVAPFELFITNGDIRHSVGIVYGKQGHLLRTANIREQRGSQTSSPWSTSIAQSEPWTPTGLWHGQRRGIRADLSQSPIQLDHWQWHGDDRRTYYFPDHIILRCPKQLKPKQPFSMEVIWKIKDNAIQTITVRYDSNARLIEVNHLSLTPRAIPDRLQPTDNTQSRRRSAARS